MAVLASGSGRGPLFAETLLSSIFSKAFWDEACSCIASSCFRSKAFLFSFRAGRFRAGGAIVIDRLGWGSSGFCWLVGQRLPCWAWARREGRTWRRVPWGRGQRVAVVVGSKCALQFLLQVLDRIKRLGHDLQVITHFLGLAFLNSVLTSKSHGNATHVTPMPLSFSNTVCASQTVGVF